MTAKRPSEAPAQRGLAAWTSPPGDASSGPPEPSAEGSDARALPVPRPDSPPLSAFSAAADAVASTRSLLAKRRIVAAYLASLPPEALGDGALFFTGLPFPRSDPRNLRVGSAAMREAALSILPWDATVLSACVRAVGDFGETLEKLLLASPPQRRGPQRSLADYGPPATDPDRPLTLADARGLFDRLAATRQASERARLLSRAWRRASPAEAKHLAKIAGGEMRIGLAETQVEEAIALAFGRPLADVRLANMVSGDVALTARLAREDRLGDAEFRLFHPLQFMLATPIESTADLREPLTGFVVEDKLDGIRAQLHKAGDRAALYSRTLSEAGEFPELIEAARDVPGAFVLDGEVVAFRDGRALPFALLQRRLGRKHVPEALAKEVPVAFVAYDCIWSDGVPLYDRPFSERRRALERLALRSPLAVSPAREVETRSEVDLEFLAARERGNEGLVLKRTDSPYEFGKRGKLWLKLKRPYATLDCVVTAAEGGHGKRAGLLSDYTFAVRGPGGSWLNVGKAFSGVTDREIEELTALFRRSTIERKGGVHLVEPCVVLEIAFDGVQESARHRSGYALRFPRIARIRPDKRPEDADTIERVRELHERALSGAGG